MTFYYAANAILNAMCGKSQYATLAPTAYVALLKAEPTRAGGNIIEPSTSIGYTRALLGNYNQSLTQKMANAADGEITSSEMLYFGEITAGDTPCTHFCVFNALTGGQPIIAGELKNPVTPTANTILAIRFSDLNISLS